MKPWLCDAVTANFHSKEEKAVLANGDVVLRITSEPCSDNEDGDPVEPDEGEEEYIKFVHVSHHSFSPCKPWVRELL